MALNTVLVVCLGNCAGPLAERPLYIVPLSSCSVAQKLKIYVIILKYKRCFHPKSNDLKKSMQVKQLNPLTPMTDANHRNKTFQRLDACATTFKKNIGNKTVSEQFQTTVILHTPNTKL